MVRAANGNDRRVERVSAAYDTRTVTAHGGALAERTSSSHPNQSRFCIGLIPRWQG